MIITISGLPGSGKSTVATRLARSLRWQQYYMGMVWRDLARERGLTLPELQALAETDDSVDQLVDEQVKKLGAQPDNIIIESRTAYHFIPDSYKIFLSVDPQEGARRIFSDLKQSDERNEGADLTSVEAVVKVNQARMASDRKRYQQYYGIDVFDEKNFDFVLDTTNISIDEVFRQVQTAVSRQLENK